MIGSEELGRVLLVGKQNGQLEKLPRLGAYMLERLKSLGIMGDQIEATLKPLKHHTTIVPRKESILAPKESIPSPVK